MIDAVNHNDKSSDIYKGVKGGARPCMWFDMIWIEYDGVDLTWWTLWGSFKGGVAFILSAECRVRAECWESEIEFRFTGELEREANYLLRFAKWVTPSWQLQDNNDRHLHGDVDPPLLLLHHISSVLDLLSMVNFVQNKNLTWHASIFLAC